MPKYYISKNDVEIAEIIKEFTFFRHEYTVNGLGWTVRGDFFDHEYEVSDGSRTVAGVSRQWFTLGDAYELDIAPDVDEVTALSVVLVIDACINAQRNN